MEYDVAVRGRACKASQYVELGHGMRLVLWSYTAPILHPSIGTFKML
jgi:hypothetical protein